MSPIAFKWTLWFLQLNVQVMLVCVLECMVAALWAAIWMRGPAKARQRKILWACVSLSPLVIAPLMLFWVLIGAHGIRVLQPLHGVISPETLEALEYSHRVTLGGDSTSGWLGIKLSRMSEIGPDNSDRREIVRISEAFPGGPAAQAGLQAGDTILEIGNAQVNAVADILRTVGNTAPGSQISIKIARGQEKQTVLVTLGLRPIENTGSERRAPPFLVLVVWVAFVWLGVYPLKQCFGFVRDRLILRRLRPEPYPLSAITRAVYDDVCSRFELTMPPRLLEVDARAEPPGVFGVWRPSIILPNAMNSLVTQPEELRAALAHECAHLRQKDLFIHVVGLRLVSWLFPVSQMALFIPNMLLRIETEIVADQQAVFVGGADPKILKELVTEYARVKCDWATHGLRMVTAVLSSKEFKHELLGRLHQEFSEPWLSLHGIVKRVATVPGACVMVLSPMMVPGMGLVFLASNPSVERTLKPILRMDAPAALPAFSYQSISIPQLVRFEPLPQVMRLEPLPQIMHFAPLPQPMQLDSLPSVPPKNPINYQSSWFTGPRSELQLPSVAGPSLEQLQRLTGPRFEFHSQPTTVPHVDSLRPSGNARPVMTPSFATSTPSAGDRSSRDSSLPTPADSAPILGRPASPGPQAQAP